MDPVAPLAGRSAECGRGATLICVVLVLSLAKLPLCADGALDDQTLALAAQLAALDPGATVSDAEAGPSLEELETLLATREEEIRRLHEKLQRAKASGTPSPFSRSAVDQSEETLSRPATLSTSESSSSIPCTSARDCPGYNQVCLRGKCQCPVLYEGADCRDHIQLGGTNERCAMGLLHPRFQGDYNGKYAVPPGEKPAKGQLVVSRSERTWHVDPKTHPGKDLPQLVDFTTCAVIGSSVALKRQELGAEIDAHTAVIRFNDAPVQGYEKWVGSKTSLRIQNLDFCGHTRVQGELCYAYSAGEGSRKCSWKGVKYPKATKAYTCTPLNPSHRNSKYLYWYWRMNKLPGVKDKACDPKCGQKPSAGMFGLLMALNMCGEVDMYGFGSSSSKEEGHYYKKTMTWARKDFSLRHHWSFERWCMSNVYRKGAIPRLTVH